MSEPIDPNAWPGAQPQEPAYPQPTYPQPQYQQPQYQQPAYQPYQAYQPYPPAGPGATVPMLTESPRRSHRQLIVASIAGGVLVAGALVAIVVSADSSVRKPGPPLPVPVAVGKYTQRTDAIVDRIRAGLVETGKSSSSTLRRFLNNGQLVIYGSGTATGTPDLFILMGRSGDYPALADATITNAVFEGFGTPQSFDPGQYGGTLQCATSSAEDEPPSACAWADSTSTGMMFSFTDAVTPKDLAQLANQARDTIDR